MKYIAVIHFQDEENRDCGRYIPMEGRTIDSAIKTIRHQIKKHEHLGAVKYDIPDWYCDAKGMLSQDIWGMYSDGRYIDELRPVRRMDALKRKIEAYVQADMEKHGKDLMTLLCRVFQIYKFEPTWENFFNFAKEHCAADCTKFFAMQRKVMDSGMRRMLNRVYFKSIYYNYFKHLDGNY